MRAREAMLDERRCCPASSGRSRSARRARRDSATFDEVLELLHLGGRPLPPRDADDDPGGVGEPRRRWTPTKRAFYRFHASLMEPWDGPASVAFTDGTVIGAVLDRNGLRPSRYWVTDDDLVVMASEVGVIDIDPAKVVTQGPPAAGPDVPDRHGAGPHRRRRRDQARRSPPSTRTASGSTRASSSSTTCPSASTSCSATTACCAASRCSATPTRSSRSSSRRWRKRHRADRVDGHRHADRRAQRAAAPAVRLLPAAVRAGHQPAARRHPRGGRHVGRRSTVGPEANLLAPGPGELPPAGAAVPDHRQRRAGQDRPHQRRRRRFPGLARRTSSRASTASPAAAWPSSGRSTAICHEVSDGHRRRARASSCSSDRNTDAVDAPIPSLLLTARRAPPPDPREAAHRGRADRRVRRRPRGAPHGAAHRLRRRGDQPVPGVRVDRGPGRRGPPRPRRRWTRTRRSRTTSRPPARACSR